MLICGSMLKALTKINLGNYVMRAKSLVSSDLFTWLASFTLLVGLPGTKLLNSKPVMILVFLLVSLIFYFKQILFKSSLIDLLLVVIYFVFASSVGIFLSGMWKMGLFGVVVFLGQIISSLLWIYLLIRFWHASQKANSGRQVL